MERIDNNWLLRSLRYVLNIDDSKMYEIFTSSGSRVSEEEVKCFLKKEEEELFLRIFDLKNKTNQFDFFFDRVLFYRCLEE